MDPGLKHSHIIEPVFEIRPGGVNTPRSSDRTRGLIGAAEGRSSAGGGPLGDIGPRGLTLRARGSGSALGRMGPGAQRRRDLWFCDDRSAPRPARAPTALPHSYGTPHAPYFRPHDGPILDVATAQARGPMAGQVTHHPCPPNPSRTQLSRRQPMRAYASVCPTALHAQRRNAVVPRTEMVEFCIRCADPLCTGKRTAGNPTGHVGQPSCRWPRASANDISKGPGGPLAAVSAWRRRRGRRCPTPARRPRLRCRPGRHPPTPSRSPPSRAARPHAAACT